MKNKRRLCHHQDCRVSVGSVLYDLCEPRCLCPCGPLPPKDHTKKLYFMTVWNKNKYNFYPKSSLFSSDFKRKPLGGPRLHPRGHLMGKWPWLQASPGTPCRDHHTPARSCRSRTASHAFVMTAPLLGEKAFRREKCSIAPKQECSQAGKGWAQLGELEAPFVPKRFHFVDTGQSPDSRKEELFHLTPFREGKE